MAKYDWVEYLALAQALSTLSNTSVLRETLERNEVSRAYYGLLGLSRRHLIVQKHDAKFRGDDTEQCVDFTNIHRYVPDTLRKSSNKNESELGEILDDLRDWRNIADYNSRLATLTPNDISLIRASIKKGKELLAAIVP